MKIKLDQWSTRETITINNHYDVISSGSSGMMAAIQAGLQDAKTLLLDKNPELGSKPLLTGMTAAILLIGRTAKN